MQLLYIISALTGGLYHLGEPLSSVQEAHHSRRDRCQSQHDAEAVQAELFGKITISSNSAIGLFVIGLLLIVVPLFLVPPSEPIYTVRGQYADGFRQHSRYHDNPTLPSLIPLREGRCEIVGLSLQHENVMVTAT